MFKFIDLFCGAGGLACGLEMAGMKCVLGSDINKAALGTFATNFPDAVLVGDISEITEEVVKPLGHIHLLVGGPPCQGFSTAGKGDPDDHRNTLFNKYCEVLKLVKPDFLVFENVTGLLAKKNQHVVEAIVSRFYEIGYRVIMKVCESQHYGVPQKRKRVIILGSRWDRKLSFPEPTHDTLFVPSRTLGDVLIDNPDSIEDLPPIDAKTWERLKYIPEGRSIRYKKDEWELLPEELHLGINWDMKPEGRLREECLKRLDRNKPAPTINTSNSNYFHPIELRRFTVRELAAIQSFPDSFIFTGCYSSQVRQIGNAVPPLMAQALGKKIMEIADSIAVKEDHILEIEEVKKGAFQYGQAKTKHKNK